MTDVTIKITGIDNLQRDNKGYYNGNVHAAVKTPYGPLDLTIPVRAPSLDDSPAKAMAMLAALGRAITQEAEICTQAGTLTTPTT